MPYARLVWWEHVIAGPDCVFFQSTLNPWLHPTVVWAKLRVLAEGTALAAKRLWSRTRQRPQRRVTALARSAGHAWISRS